MLPARLALFAFWQVVIAAAFLGAGAAQPWEASAAWWPLTASLANLVCVGLLVRLYRAEGGRFWDVFRLHRETLGKDLLTVLGLLVLMAPIAALPNPLLAGWLFGDPQAAMTLMFRPLPAWGRILGLSLFPATIALAELPTYFAYSLPRLEAQTGRRWLAVLLSASALAAQHCTLPLLFDGRFFAWRLLMYLPFALSVALALRWRPRLLPFFVVGHALIDLAAASMIPGV
jgi:hypothetical protein